MSADAVIDEGHAAAVLEPQDSTTLASSGGGGERVETDRRSSINSVLDAMFASGVELGQDVRRARLSSGGIENIAISFVGGTDMPATESSVGNAFTYAHKGKQHVGVLSGIGGWAGVAMNLGLTNDTDALGAAGGYKELTKYNAAPGARKCSLMAIHQSVMTGGPATQE
jgi:hypothetical protein